MWKNKNLVILFLVSTLFYVAVNLPFEFGLIFFDMKSFQPASSLPVVLGLFFGPAGVLGVGLGEFFVEIFAGLSFLAPFIIMGKMLMALLAYRLWDKLLIKNDINLRIPKSDKRLFVYNLAVLILITSMAKSLVIGWGYLLVKSDIFYKSVLSIFANDIIGGLLLSVFALFIFLNRFRKWDMIWSDLMNPGDVKNDSKFGVTIILSSILIFFFISIAFSYFGFDNVPIICGGLSIIGIFTGLFWKRNIS